MKKLRSILAFLLVLAMCLSFGVVSFAATDENEEDGEVVLDGLDPDEGWVKVGTTVAGNGTEYPVYLNTEGQYVRESRGSWIEVTDTSAITFDEPATTEGEGGTETTEGEGGTETTEGEGGNEPNGGEGGNEPNGGEGGNEPNGGEGGNNATNLPNGVDEYTVNTYSYLWDPRANDGKGYYVLDEDGEIVVPEDIGDSITCDEFGGEICGDYVWAVFVNGTGTEKREKIEVEHVRYTTTSDCTEAGTAVCKNCGWSWDDKALGHTWSSDVDGYFWGKIEEGASCDKGGIAYDYCVVCGVLGTKTRTVLPTSHTYKFVVDQAPVCDPKNPYDPEGEAGDSAAAFLAALKDGCGHFECKVCGYKPEKVTMSSGDAFVSTATVTDATKGVKNDKIAVKAAEYLDFINIGKDDKDKTAYDEIGHEWSVWVTDIEAGCDTAGRRHRVCVNCWIDQSKTIAATGHGPMVLLEEHVADCYTAYYVYICSTCGKGFVVKDGAFQIKKDGKWKDADFETYTAASSSNKRFITANALEVYKNGRYTINWKTEDLSAYKQVPEFEGHTFIYTKEYEIKALSPFFTKDAVSCEEEYGKWYVCAYCGVEGGKNYDTLFGKNGVVPSILGEYAKLADADVVAAKAAYDEAVEAYNAKNTEYEAYGEFEGVDAALADLNAANTAAATAKTEADDAAEALDKANKASEDAAEEVSDLNDDIAQAEEDLSDAEDALDTANAELGSWITSNNQNNVYYQLYLSNPNSRLIPPDVRDQIADMLGAIDNAKTDIDQLKADLAQYAIDLAIAKAKAEAAAAKADLAKNISDAKAAALTAANAEAAAKKAVYDTAVAGEKAFNDAKDALKAEVDALKAEMEKAEAKCAAVVANAKADPAPYIKDLKKLNYVSFKAEGVKEHNWSDWQYVNYATKQDGTVIYHYSRTCVIDIINGVHVGCGIVEDYNGYDDPTTFTPPEDPSDIIDPYVPVEPIPNEYMIDTTGIECSAAGVNGTGKIVKIAGNQPEETKYVYIVVNYERADGTTWAIAGTYKVDEDGSFDMPYISGIYDTLTGVNIVALDSKVGAEWFGHNIAAPAKV